jgi:hypothetical protein
MWASIAGDLRRAVGAQAEGTAAQLVDQLEGLQVELVTGPRQQRLDVLEHRRDDQLEAEAASRIEQAPTQGFDVAGPRRKDIGDVLRQQPGRGHAKTPLVKKQIVRVGRCRAAANPAARPRGDDRRERGGVVLSGPERQQHRQPRNDADQAEETDLAVAHLQGVLEDPTPRDRADEGQQSLGDQHQGDGAERHVPERNRPQSLFPRPAAGRARERTGARSGRAST